MVPLIWSLREAGGARVGERSASIILAGASRATRHLPAISSLLRVRQASTEHGRRASGAARWRFDRKPRLAPRPRLRAPHRQPGHAPNTSGAIMASIPSNPDTRPTFRGTAKPG